MNYSALPPSPFLYPILDYSFSTNLFVDAQDLIRAGARILQVRVKNETKRRIYEITSEIAALCAESNVSCILNDCVDIALITGVTGVHLGQMDFPVNEARNLLQRKVIGFSTHSREQFAAAGDQPVDYVAIGPVFQTKSKINAGKPLGLSVLRSIVREKKKPVVAIGGIGNDHIAHLIDSGIDGIALISALYRDGRLYENACRMMEKIREKV